ncbi:MAG: T9SS type A sorting domain-containing protein [Saprospiraceae bacterium]|nr:T9SS type A sorting domain-containing protein [Saprospiraceae bacterium]
MKKFTILFSLFFVSFYVVGQNSPVAINDTSYAYAGCTISVNVLLNDYDPDGDTIILKFVGTNHGQAIKSDSSIIFTPEIFRAGWVRISYRITEKNNTSNKDTASLWVFVSNNGFEFLETNNIKARINAFGNQFWDGENLNFEVPKGSGKHTIFTSSLWAGGSDNSSNLYLAGERFRGNGEDFFAGPVMDSTAYSTSQDSLWNKVWKISKAEIDYHRNHWWDANYVPITNILTWPGNGNTTLGQAAQLAPYFDNNNDGIYNAYDGDYPLMRGHECIFFIYNDDRNTHTETGGKKLKIEIHGMAYAFDCPLDSAFNNTIFIHYDIYNRSNINYSNAYFANFTDFDIGGSYDDYIGCDVQRATIFGYNGDDIDESGNGNLGYGTHPPAQAVTILKGPLMDSDGIDNPFGINEGVNGLYFGDSIQDNECLGMTRSVYFNNTGSGGHPAMQDPNYAAEYYRYMNGMWKDSTHFLYGGNGYNSSAYGPQCNFIYPGTSDPTNWGTGGVVPNGPVNWTENSSNNVPYDRRGIGVMGPFTFNAGDKETIDLAYIFARNYNVTSAEAALDVLKVRIDSIISGYLLDKSPCGGSFTNINKIPNLKYNLKVFPNPANDEIFIEYKNLSKKSQYFIFDMFGKLVKTGVLKESELNNISINDLNTGLYILKVLEGSDATNIRFIKM